MRNIIRLNTWLMIALMAANTANQIAAAQQNNTASDPPVAKLTSSVDSVQIAEPFEITIVVTCSRGAKLNFPAVDQRFGDFDVIDHVDQFDLPTEQDSSMRTWTRRMTVETLETGQLKTPPYEIAVITAAGQQLKLTPTPLTINVVSVLEDNVDARKFNDIKNVIDVEIEPVASHSWIVWTIGGFLGVALIASGIIFATRRKRWITPAQWALTQLNGPNSHEISGIETTLRSFIQQEFGFPASSFSIEQIHAALLREKITDQTCDQVCDLLRRSEQVRFAGLQLDGHQLESLRTDAMAVINELNNLHTEAR